MHVLTTFLYIFQEDARMTEGFVNRYDHEQILNLVKSFLPKERVQVHTPHENQVLLHILLYSN